MRLQALQSRKIKFYSILYELTRNSCELCVTTGCKCTDGICSHVEKVAALQGVRFPKHNETPLRFIAKTGCVVPPHHRETCTIYLCEYALNKPTFNRLRYQKLVRICQKIEWQLLCLQN